MSTLPTIRACMQASPPTTIHIVYLDAKDQPSAREVEPYEIRNGTLFTRCLKSAAEGKNPSTRQFKVERIVEARPGAAFTPLFPVVVPA